MNDLEPRTRLSQLGIGIALNETKDGIILTGATGRELSQDLRKALENGRGSVGTSAVTLDRLVITSPNAVVETMGPDSMLPR